MKKQTANTGIQKKLQLKKTAISNLQMSEEKMRAVVGGGNGKNTTSDALIETGCTTIVSGETK